MAATSNERNETMRYLVRLGRVRAMRRESAMVGEVVERLKESTPENSTDILEMAEFLTMVDRVEALKIVTGFLSVEWNATVAHEVERARKLRAELLAGTQ